MTANRKLAGLAIAASAAALLVAGCANTGTGASAGATSAKVLCEGANACKGLSDCKTANNACAGQNECKGLGVVSLTSDQCAKVTGRTG